MSRSSEEPTLIGCEVRPLERVLPRNVCSTSSIPLGVPDKSGNLKMTSIRFDFTDISAERPPHGLSTNLVSGKWGISPIRPPESHWRVVSAARVADLLTGWSQLHRISGDVFRSPSVGVREICSIYRACLSGDRSAAYKWSPRADSAFSRCENAAAARAVLKSYTIHPTDRNRAVTKAIATVVNMVTFASIAGQHSITTPH